MDQELAQCRRLREYATENIDDADVRALTFESALSRGFRAHENFVEGAFLAYLVGETTLSGIEVKRFANPPTSEHGRRMVQGASKFLDWADPSVVLARCESFLDADGPLAAAMTGTWNTIDWMRRIRNHVSHNSVESMIQYKKVAQVLLLVDRPDPIRPGDLLQQRPQRGPFKGREILSGLFDGIEAFAIAATE